MALGAALLLIGGLAVGPSPGVAVRAALAVMAAPALAGILLRFRADSRRDRLLVLGGWGLAAISASALSGGMSGPLTGLLVLPVAAGLLLGGATWGMTGGLVGLGATATAILVGLLSVWMAGAAPDAPLLSSGAALLAVLGAAAALRWTWGPREAAAALAGQALRRAEDLVAAQPGLTLILTPQGGLLGAQGRAPPALDVVAVGEQGLVALTHAPDRPRLLEGLARAAAQSGDAEPVQIVLTPREALDRRVTLYVRRLDAPTGVASAAPAASPAASARLIAQAFDGTAQFAREHGLETARAEAAARDAGKSRFLANMSHELRTPLNAIMGFSEVMKEQHLGPVKNTRYLGYAADIHTSGRYLLGIINDILDLSKIEAGKMSLENAEEFALRHSLEGSLAMVADLGKKYGVQVIGALPPESVRLVAVDRMIRQIMINLVSNAIKFTPEGGHVRVSGAALAGGGYAVTVEDSGIGMTDAEIVEALTPFGQVENKMTATHNGTGLGLPLAKAMLELHDGTLAISSMPGHGTRIVLHFPASRIRIDRGAAAA